jgi:DNA polymerase III epsilon subunit family exonuclease
MFDLSNAPFAFLDIETTGLSPWFGDRICQIGILLTEGRRIKTSLDLLINPERPLSPAAAHVNGLDESELAKAPRFEEIAGKLESLLKDKVIVCHNAKFDIEFFDSEFRKLGRAIEFPNLIDTLLLARQYYELPSYSLQFLAEAFQVTGNLNAMPRPQADALTAKNVFFAMMESLRKYGKPLEEFIGIYNSPAWPDEGVQLPIELGEAIYSGKRLFLRYMDKDGEISERWITPQKVIGLTDYVYLQAYCHTRQADRTFRLDRILDIAVEVENSSP